MTLLDIANKVAEERGYAPSATKDILLRAVRHMVDAIDSEEELKIRGFGSFRWTPVKERKVHDINRGIKLHVPAGRKLKFYPTEKLKTRRVKCQTTKMTE